jgi:aryl-alcohol dehydrogenase-like predicted oxidoreductase
VPAFSPLGFGCSQLAGLTARSREAVLNTAFDEGVTHFDVARSYGLGRAESALGKFVRAHRDEVTLTTKAGIRPANLAVGALGKATELAAARISSKLASSAAAQRLRAKTSYGHFRLDEVRDDLGRSLSALKVDHIDVYLLHACHPDDLTDDLLSFLERQRKAGVIGAFGIATDAGSTKAITETRPEFAGVIQVKNSVFERFEGKPCFQPLGLFTHGALQELEKFRAQCGRDESLQRLLRDEVGIDPVEPQSLVRVLLRYALDTHPDATVLFSTTSPVHVRENAAIAAGPALSEEHLDRIRLAIQDRVGGAKP